MNAEIFTLESCGITKSPLDAYRGRGNHSGITDNNAPLSIKQKEQKYFYNLDIAGNKVLVEHIPTITKKMELTEMKLEEMIKKYRSISPCPCKSKECEEDYLNDKKKLVILEGKAEALKEGIDYETLFNKK